MNIPPFYQLLIQHLLRGYGYQPTSSGLMYSGAGATGPQQPPMDPRIFMGPNTDAGYVAPQGYQPVSKGYMYTGTAEEGPDDDSQPAKGSIYMGGYVPPAYQQPSKGRMYMGPALSAADELRMFGK